MPKLEVPHMRLRWEAIEDWAKDLHSKIPLHAALWGFSLVDSRLPRHYEGEGDTAPIWG
jgi:hypothetical protein